MAASVQSLGERQTSPPYLRGTTCGVRDGGLGFFAQLRHSSPPKSLGFRRLKNHKHLNPPERPITAMTHCAQRAKVPTSLAPPGALVRAVPAALRSCHGHVQNVPGQGALASKKGERSLREGHDLPPSHPYETCPSSEGASVCPTTESPSSNGRGCCRVRPSDAPAQLWVTRCPRDNFLQPEMLLSCCCQILSKNHQTN